MYRCWVLVAAGDRVSPNAQRQDEDQDRRQDGGKKQLSHSNHLLCGTDQRREGHRADVQSAQTTAARARCAINRRVPMAQATAINFTPNRAAPRLPRAAPTHPTGNASTCSATAAGSTAKNKAATATRASASAEPKPSPLRSASG